MKRIDLWILLIILAGIIFFLFGYAVGYESANPIIQITNTTDILDLACKYHGITEDDKCFYAPSDKDNEGYYWFRTPSGEWASLFGTGFREYYIKYLGE